MSETKQNHNISKTNIQDLYNEIQQLFSKYMNNMKQLIDNFKILEEKDQQYIVKASNRILKFLKVNLLPLQIQSRQQEPFNEQDYSKIYTQLSHFYTFQIQAVESIKQMQTNSELEKLEVDEKTSNFIEIHYQRGIYLYYGYLLKKKPTGRGILFNPFVICDGYFIEGEFVFGQQLFESFGQLKCVKINQDMLNKKQNKDIINPLQVASIVAQLGKMDCQLARHIKIQNLIFVIFNLNYKSQLNQDNAVYREEGQYHGYMLNGVRDGIGKFYNKQKRVFGWGLWQGDLLKFGVLIKLENDKLIEKYGDIDDDLQQYLF